MIYPDDFVNKIINADALEALSIIPDNIIHLIITSPPYNVGMDYGVSDRKNYNNYLSFMKKVLQECYRVLIPGGRIAVNVPSSILQSSSSRMAYLSLDIVLLMREVGFLDREWVTWIKMPKGEIAGSSTAWGSWMSPSCPYLRDACEYVIVMDKESHKRTDKSGVNDITSEEFLKFTSNCWYIPPEKNRNHPAPFPPGLPYRLIKLYSWENDIVLDPFVGSGTTAVVAKKCNRKFIGIDINSEFCIMAEERLKLVSRSLGIKYA